jgi:hypothetical protein
VARVIQAVGAFSILTLAIQAPGTMVVVYFLLFVASEDVRLPAGLSFVMPRRALTHRPLLSLMTRNNNRYPLGFPTSLPVCSSSCCSPCCCTSSFGTAGTSFLLSRCAGAQLCWAVMLLRSPRAYCQQQEAREEGGRAKRRGDDAHFHSDNQGTSRCALQKGPVYFSRTLPLFCFLTRTWRGEERTKTLRERPKTKARLQKGRKSESTGTRASDPGACCVRSFMLCSIYF